MGKSPDNPFMITGYYGPEYFCDREEETSRILSYLMNGNSVTLFAIRRTGKTGLIRHILYNLPDTWESIYLDILETENINGFLNVLATAILQSIPEKTSFGRKLWNMIKSLRPAISFDSLTGEPKAFFSIERNEAEKGIEALLQHLEEQNKKIVIAIDEFQQILQYPEENAASWLRARIQKLNNVVFIFSGSQHHIVSDMFASPGKPFYKSTSLFKLEKINKTSYTDFIIRQFNNSKKRIDHETVEGILNWTNIHTFYVQQLCNRVFASGTKEIIQNTWQHEASVLLKENETVFFGLRNLLTNPQWQLIKAIAAEGQVFTPTATAFVRKHKLGNTATILRSLKSLQNYELIYYDFNENGEKFYSVYDVLFQRWVEGKFL